MFRALLASLILALPALARPALGAAPEGAVSYANGFWKLPAGGALPSTFVRLPWIDAKGRLLYEPRNEIHSALHCFDPVAGTDVQVFGSGIAAVGAGVDAAVLLRQDPTKTGAWDLLRISCDTGETLAGSADLSAFGGELPYRGLGVLADGTAFFLTPQGVLRLSPGAAGLVPTHVPFEPLRAVLRPGTEKLVDDAHWPTTTVRATGLATDDGSVWLLLDIPDYTNAPAAWWVVRLLPDRTFELRLGPVLRKDGYPAGGLGYDRERRALVVGGVTLDIGGKAVRQVGYFPLDGHRKLDAGGVLPPWPSDPGLLGPHDASLYTGYLVPAADGALSAITLDGLMTLGVDEDVADFDGDGLIAAVERARGLTDLEDDADGDGIPDGMEVDVLATDPLDPTSGPQPLPAGLLAPSSQVTTWPFPDPAWCQAADLSGRAVCTASDFTGSGMVLEPTAFACVGEDGEPLGEFPGHATFSPDGQVAFVSEETGVSRRDRTGAVTRTWPYVAFPGLYVLSADLAFAHVNGRLTRLHGDGTTFELFDASRPCPLAGSAAQGSGCKGPLRDSTLYDTRPVGIDFRSNRLIVAARGMTSAFLASVGDGDVQYLMRAGRFPGGALPAQVLRRPDAPGFTVVAPSGAMTMTGEGLDARHASPIGPHKPLGGWFRGGFLVLESEMFKVPHENVAQSCKAAWGEITICDTDGPPKSWDDRVMFTFMQWMPVPTAPEPGEVIFFSAQAKADLISFRDAPMLWRYALDGGVLPWLDAGGLDALADASTRSALAAVPLSKIRSIAFSPDGRRMCLAEPPARRTFELALDAQRVPTGLSIVAPDADTLACGYADDGTLVRLVDGAVAKLAGAASTTDLPGVKRPFGLVRFAGGFLVLAFDASACVDASGAVRDIPAIHAAAVLGDRVAYVDAQGIGHVQGIAALCNGDAPTERLVADSGVPDLSFWTATYLAAGTSQRRVPPGPGLVHPLPNGDFLVAHTGPPENETDPDLEAYLGGWLYRYRATWGSGGLAPGASLRPAPRVTIASHHAWSARCAATVPGSYTPPVDDWEFLGTSGPPDPPDSGPDAGPDADPGPDAVPASGEGGGGSGCANSAPPGPMSLVLVFACLVAIPLRRRRA